MRLPEPERRIIVNAIKRIDSESMIFLFGSRVDNMSRGGDIDLLILTEKMTYDDKERGRNNFLI